MKEIIPGESFLFEATTCPNNNNDDNTISSSIKEDEQQQEEKKKKNPIVNGVKSFFSRMRPRRRKQKKQKLNEKGKTSSAIRSLFPRAFSPLDDDSTTKLTPLKESIVQDLAQKCNDVIPNFENRVKEVSWGGSSNSKWWDYNNNKKKKGSSILLEGYLRIMQWPKDDTTTKFPFRLCKKECPKEFALQHTLEWREEYKPWCIPSVLNNENQKGYFYVRGYSPSSDTNNNNNKQGHALVWYRSGMHKYQNASEWIRMIVHTLDRSVADTLMRTNGKVGRFNAIIDAGDFSGSGEMPGFTKLKELITILQDHFPDRLGVVFLLNFSKSAQFLFGLIKPIISKEVREKIIMVPSDNNNNNNPRQEMLDNFIAAEFLPKSLGGNAEEYKFNPKLYYR
eukprot:CAMPEP_0194190734 /NCGR_PEP_ID=MMETSP0154-20130528/64001_1 /TAXON_ID=1049557 /ORGANISM="Thalassiothrix antarctica, Strain L6-D1" /LENGTH=393 /DNA_ID=CAMNT_0038912841 /DNA_START=252 /DNA_END=1429 /DNA_ORIENTATION=-